MCRRTCPVLNEKQLPLWFVHRRTGNAPVRQFHLSGATIPECIAVAFERRVINVNHIAVLAGVHISYSSLRITNLQTISVHDKHVDVVVVFSPLYAPLMSDLQRFAFCN